MLRILAAVILSLSIALPGVVMASPEHHSQLKTEHAGVGQQKHHHDSSCDSADCKPEVLMMCCALMMGHCSSFGVPTDTAKPCMRSVFGLAGLSYDTAQLMIGRTFVVDPPPPRA